MIRHHTRPVDTEFGTFYIGVTAPNGEHGPEAFAETETGEVTVNGVTYTGAIYFRRRPFDGHLYCSTQHLRRWDDKRMTFQPTSESADRKLDAALRPHVDELLADDAHVLQRRIDVLEVERRAARDEATRAVEKANDVARTMRELGADVDDVTIQGA